MKSVKWLSLMACSKVTDNGLINIISMNTLDALDLRGCNAITDNGLEHLSQMKSLKQVLIGGCDRVTNEAVIRLQKELPYAKVEKNDGEWASHKKGKI